MSSISDHWITQRARLPLSLSVPLPPFWLNTKFERTAVCSLLCIDLYTWHRNKIYGASQGSSLSLSGYELLLLTPRVARELAWYCLMKYTGKRATKINFVKWERHTHARVLSAFPPILLTSERATEWFPQNIYSTGTILNTSLKSSLALFASSTESYMRDCGNNRTH